MKILFAGFATFLCLFALPARLGAVQETTISASPAILDLAIIPGETTNAELTVRNGGEFGLPISLVPKSITTEEDIFINQDRNIPDASEWVSIDESEFILSPGEIKKVPVDIDTPENTPPGGYYAEISIRGLSLEQSIEQGTSIVVPEITITMLLSVPGETFSEMEISNNILPFFATPRTNYNANFTVINNGNIHDLVTPEFVVAKSGEEIYRQRLTSNIILPNLEKNYTENLQLPDAYGAFDAYIELSYGNGQEVIKSNTEKLIITPLLKSVFVVGLLTMFSLFAINHRKNFKAFWKELTKSS